MTLDGWYPFRWFWASVLVLAVLGCSGNVYELGQRYGPLERIREAEVPGLSPDASMTVFTEVLTRDLASLLAARPPGSVAFEAFVQHERVHSVRQFSDPTFFARYAASKDFRWQEEAAAYAVEISVFKKAGYQIDVEGYVEALAGPIYRGMVSRERARAWVLEQLRAP